MRRGYDMDKVIKNKIKRLSVMRVVNFSNKIDPWKILVKLRRGKGKGVILRFYEMQQLREEHIRQIKN